MTDRYVLVSFKDTEDKSKSVKLRRFLGNAKMSYIFTSNPDEMKEYVDKIPTDPSAFGKYVQEHPIMEEDVTIHAETMIASNQEILEQWARGTFSEDSVEMKLLFGSTPPQPIVLDSEDDESNGDHSSPEDTERDVIDNSLTQCLQPPLSDHDSSQLVQDDTVHFCALCNAYIEVGKTRNTKVKRQSGHVMFKHHSPEFLDFSLLRRYQCQRCMRSLPVHKSPCEHISEYHSTDKEETDFIDIWSKPQLKAFNMMLERCFGRQLPRPRNRRLRNGNSWVIHSKASYRIKQGDEVTQIDTLYEKMACPFIAPQLETSSSERVEEEHRKEQLQQHIEEQKHMEMQMHIEEQEQIGVQAHTERLPVAPKHEDHDVIYLDDDEDML